MEQTSPFWGSLNVINRIIREQELKLIMNKICIQSEQCGELALSQSPKSVSPKRFRKFDGRKFFDKVCGLVLRGFYCVFVCYNVNFVKFMLVLFVSPSAPKLNQRSKFNQITNNIIHSANKTIISIHTEERVTNFSSEPE
jgi:hypothetical protein